MALIDTRPIEEEFMPNTRGRLMTAMDASLSAACSVHPEVELALQALSDEHLAKHNETKNYRDILAKIDSPHDKQKAVVLCLTHMERHPDTKPESYILDALCRRAANHTKTLYFCGMRGCRHRRPNTLQHQREHLLSSIHFNHKYFACGQWCVPRLEGYLDLITTVAGNGFSLATMFRSTPRNITLQALVALLWQDLSQKIFYLQNKQMLLLQRKSQLPPH